MSILSQPPNWLRLQTFTTKLRSPDFSKPQVNSFWFVIYKPVWGPLDLAKVSFDTLLLWTLLRSVLKYSIVVFPHYLSLCPWELFELKMFVIGSVYGIFFRYIWIFFYYTIDSHFYDHVSLQNTAGLSRCSLNSKHSLQDPDVPGWFSILFQPLLL